MHVMIVRSVAVLGAGTMGAQIAAHFANSGVPVLLLDLTADAAAQGLKKARALKPDPFFTPDAGTLITTGGFDDYLRDGSGAGEPKAGVADADWIIEAVVERLDVKQALLARVDATRRAGSVVSSNTSGISIAALADGRSPDFRSHWLGTHFFNPPRYLHLLEIIPTPDTGAAVVDAVRAFADHRLGKGVVVAKDSPGFIGNHIALHGMLEILNRVASGEYSIEEVDAVTGPALGRPKSATFRTLDLAGLDIVGHVIADLHQRLPDEAARAAFVLPEFVTRMIAQGMTGEKAGGGFYKRVKNAAGESEILVIDPATLEYGPQRKPRLASLEAARAVADPVERVRMLFHAKDKAGQLLRDTLPQLLRYAAKVTPMVAFAPDDVDRVLQWGFGWELGPLELADAIGIDGLPKFRDGRVQPAAPDLQILRSAKNRSSLVRTNAGASLVDIGEGVLCVEFHSKMNVLGADAMQMLQAGVREAASNFAALVVGNEGEHFSAGANLMLVLLEAQEENWDGDRPDDPHVPADEHDAAHFRGARRRRGGRPRARRRLRDRAARRPGPGGGGDLPRPRRGRRRPHPGGRRHEGDGRPRSGIAPERRERSPAADSARVRDDCLREDIDQRR